MTDPAGRYVDAERLRAYLREQIPGPDAPLELETHVAGFSNITLFVTRGGDRWVLRRPPLGPLLPGTHDVLREHRFLAALHGQVRVPRPVLACDDDSVIGAPFYLMERVDGLVCRERIPEQHDTPDGRRRMAEEMIDAMVELHAVDWEAAGVRGRREGYLERQLDLWSRQWEATRAATRDLPGIDEGLTWLRAHMPRSQEATVVHGDYKLDNIMFARDEPRVIAIFDWEMATVGDPLADLAWLLAYWGDPDDPIANKDGKWLATDASRRLTARGFPSRSELAARYAERSGRDVDDLGAYQVLAVLKLCVILEGLYRGYLEGSEANPESADFEWGVPQLVARVGRFVAAAGE